MLKRTLSGKYKQKEKKEIDKKKILKFIIIFFSLILLFFSIFTGIKLTNEYKKPVKVLYEEEKYERIAKLYDNKSNLLTGTQEENLLIAKSLYLIERYEDSIKAYESILSEIKMRDINKARIQYDYIQPLIKIGKVEEALIIMDEAITWADADLGLAKDLRRIYGLLVAAKPTEDNLEKGITNLSEYLAYEFDQKDWEANYYMALLYYYYGDYDNAVNYAIKTLQINQFDEKAKHLIPKIYYEASDYHKAIESLKSLNKVEINNIDNYLLMGKCYELLDDWHNAALAYNKVVDLDSVNEKGHMGLVRVYTMSKNTPKLTEELYKVKDLDFSEENKEIISILLKQIVPTVITTPPNIDWENIK